MKKLFTPLGVALVYSVLSVLFFSTYGIVLFTYNRTSSRTRLILLFITLFLAVLTMIFRLLEKKYAPPKQ